jgi:hypothetical protein
MRKLCDQVITLLIDYRTHKQLMTFWCYRSIDHIAVLCDQLITEYRLRLKLKLCDQLITSIKKDIAMLCNQFSTEYRLHLKLKLCDQLITLITNHIRMLCDQLITDINHLGNIMNVKCDHLMLLFELKTKELIKIEIGTLLC